MTHRRIRTMMLSSFREKQKGRGGGCLDVAAKYRGCPAVYGLARCVVEKEEFWVFTLLRVYLYMAGLITGFDQIKSGQWLCTIESNKTSEAFLNFAIIQYSPRCRSLLFVSFFHNSPKFLCESAMGSTQYQLPHQACRS